MDAKLRLKINKRTISNKNDIVVSPFVKSILSGNSIPSNLDYKTLYSNYLTEKYK